MRTRELSLRAGGVELAGTLSIPDAARGLVVFAHGSGSSRLSPRNRRVAAALEARGLATLLFDLLTAEEERTDADTRVAPLRDGIPTPANGGRSRPTVAPLRSAGDAHLRFDIPRLAGRLVEVVDWAGRDSRGLALGCFGARTGAAAALIAAAERPRAIRAVVSRGGRPDLAGEHLARVQAPALFIVGGADREVLALNQHARARMPTPARLAVLPGATHLFEEPGALEQVARLAGDFFLEHLAAERRPEDQGTTT